MQEKKNKFYQRRWFLWLFLILFPPVGIILLWTCHKEMKKNTRIILTVVFGIWFIMMLAMRGGVQDGYKAGIQNTTPATTQTERHESSEATSKQADNPDTDANGWTDNDYGEFRAATKSISDEYVANYKAPWGNDEWSFAKFDDKGKIIVTTKYTFDNTDEKQDVICVFTRGKDKDKDGYADSYKDHFLSIGNKLYLDDGSCDKVFKKMANLK